MNRGETDSPVAAAYLTGPGIRGHAYEPVTINPSRCTDFQRSLRTAPVTCVFHTTFISNAYTARTFIERSFRTRQISTSFLSFYYATFITLDKIQLDFDYSTFLLCDNTLTVSSTVRSSYKSHGVTINYIRSPSTSK